MIVYLDQSNYTYDTLASGPWVGCRLLVRPVFGHSDACRADAAGRARAGVGLLHGYSDHTVVVVSAGPWLMLACVLDRHGKKEEAWILGDGLGDSVLRSEQLHLQYSGVWAMGWLYVAGAAGVWS